MEPIIQCCRWKTFYLFYL